MFTKIKAWFHNLVVAETKKAHEALQLETKLEAEVLRLTNPIGPYVDDLKKALGVEAQRVQTESISAAHLQIKDIIAAETTAFIARIRQLETLLKEKPSQWKPDAETVSSRPSVAKGEVMVSTSTNSWRVGERKKIERAGHKVVINSFPANCCFSSLIGNRPLAWCSPHHRLEAPGKSIFRGLNECFAKYVTASSLQTNKDKQRNLANVIEEVLAPIAEHRNVNVKEAGGFYRVRFEGRATNALGLTIVEAKKRLRTLENEYRPSKFWHAKSDNEPK